MSDINNAVDAIRKLARMFEPMTNVADVLEKVGSLDNAQKEHEKALVALSAEKESLGAEVKKLKAKAKEASDKINADISDAKLEAEAILNEARATSETLIADGKAKANLIEQKAAQKAKESEKQSEDSVKAAQSALKEESIKLSAITQEIEDKSKELEELKGAIDGTRAKLSALLGA